MSTPAARAPDPVPNPVPVGRTARRLTWEHLPPNVRDLVERRIGTAVVEAVSQTAGFTPGFASVLVGADGTRHFVKAASVRAQRQFAESYREEARKLAALPDGVPAPRLLWSHLGEEWVVLGIEHVSARAPRRPWRDDELRRCLDMLADLARDLTPAPSGMALVPIASDLADVPAMWEQVRRAADRPHAAEAASLAARLPEIVGDSLVHADVRDDNLLLTDDDRVLLCDWNWPVAGPPWLDALVLLVGPRGDGLDVEALLASHPAFAAADAERVDVVLALLAGYFLGAALQPVPPTSPHIRDAQRWQGEVCWAWLCQRRGWGVGA